MMTSLYTSSETVNKLIFEQSTPVVTVCLGVKKARRGPYKAKSCTAEPTNGTKAVELVFFTGALPKQLSKWGDLPAELAADALNTIDKSRWTKRGLARTLSAKKNGETLVNTCVVRCGLALPQKIPKCVKASAKGIVNFPKGSAAELDEEGDGEGGCDEACMFCFLLFVFCCVVVVVIVVILTNSITRKIK